MRQVPTYENHQLASKSSDYCVCVFVINEGEKLLSQLARMQPVCQGLADVVVADGGSTDGSTEPERLRALGVNTLLVKTGSGKLGSQMRMAFDWALTRGYLGVVVIDGNGKDGVEAIPRFIEALRQGIDHVQGSRFIPGGHHENTPKSRILGLKWLHAPLIRLASGFPYTDTTNGFRAYSGRLLASPEVNPFRDCFTGYELHYHLAVEAGRLHFNVKEIPVTRFYPKTGKVPTKISPIKGNANVIQKLFLASSGYYSDQPRAEWWFKILIGAFGMAVTLLIAALGFYQASQYDVDFRLRYHEAMHVRHGIDPFDVFTGQREAVYGGVNINAPWTYWFMETFTFLPYPVAKTLFILINAFAILFVLWVSCRTIKRLTNKNSDLLLTTGLVLCTWQLKWLLLNLNFGLLCAAGIGIMLLALNRKRDYLAGLGFFLVMLKPQIGFLFTIPLLVKLKIKTLLTTGGLCLAGLLVTAAQVGKSPLTLLLETVSGGQGYLTADSFKMYSILHHFNIASPSTIQLIQLATGILLVVYCTSRARKCTDWLYLLIPPSVSCLLAFYGQRHDQVVLFLFVTLTVARFSLTQSRWKYLLFAYTMALVMDPSWYAAWGFDDLDIGIHNIWRYGSFATLLVALHAWPRSNFIPQLQKELPLDER